MDTSKIPAGFRDALKACLQDREDIPMDAALEYLDEHCGAFENGMTPAKCARLIEDNYMTKIKRESDGDIYDGEKENLLHDWLMDIDQDYRSAFKNGSFMTRYLNLADYWDMELNVDYCFVVGEEYLCLFHNP